VTTNLDILLNQYCPNGVPWVKLGEVLDYEQPTLYLVHSTEYNNAFPTPVLTAGQSFILGYTDETNGIYKASKQNPVIIFDDFTTSFHWVDFDFKVKSSAMKMLKVKTNDYFRYIYYAMKIIDFVPTEHSRHWISVYSQFEIPLPPLPVQEEIVRILDSMTALIENIDEEIKIQKNLYSFSRENLLTKLNNNHILGDVIASLRTGLNPRIYFKLNPPDAMGFYVTVRELSGFDIKVDDKTDKIDTAAVNMINVRSKLKYGDILFSGTGTIGRTAIVKKQNFQWNIKEGVYVLTPTQRILSRYLIYICHSNSFIEQIDNKAGGSTVRSISMNDLKTISIPVPPLSVQQQIVDQLDTFEALINNLKTERDLRQKQYTYYREKLLTFK